MTALIALRAWVIGESRWLTLFAVAIAGAWLYVQFGHVSADRDRFRQWAEVTCAAAGQPFAASTSAVTDAAGKPVMLARAAGELCRRKVGDLAAFRADTARETAETLAAAMRAQAERQTTDTAAARAAALAARDAAFAMEKADAEAERRNLVDHEWFRAVNGVAGLRAPPAR